jgi:myo-inositol 2-dehydrogenase/D-chiro-inositol 1-dehydrogenase
VSSAKPTYFFLERYMPSYAAEWAAFVDAIATNGTLPVTLQDGVAALAMAEAATLSAKTGQPVALKDML